MDTGNGSQAVFSDAVGKPVSKPNTASDLASPINLLNPDRYEFYTFDDSGDLVKRLMTLDEIQGIVASGDSEGFNFDPLSGEDYTPEKRVNDIVNNVQNVLKEEMEIHKDTIDTKPLFDTPDVSDSWSMILPAIFGNSGEDIKPEKPIMHVTPDTIMIEPTFQPARSPSTPKPFQSTTVINNIVWTSPRSTTARPFTTARSTTLGGASSKITPSIFSTTPGIPFSTKVVVNQQNFSDINVEVYSHSKSTTERSTVQVVNNVPIIQGPEIELTKDNARPIYHVSSTPSSTRQPPTTTFFIRPSTNFLTTLLSSSSRPFSTNQPSSSTKLPTISQSSSSTKLPTTYQSSSSTKLPTTYQLSSSTKLPTTYQTSFSTKLPTTYQPSYTKLPTTYQQLTTQSYLATKIPSSTTKLTTPLYITSTRLPPSTTPSTTTSTTTTTELPMSTAILQNSLPTLAQLLHLNQLSSSSSVRPSSSSMATTTTTLKMTPLITPKPDTTPSLSTFTIVSSTNGAPIVTTATKEETNVTPIINQLLNNFQNQVVTTTVEDDLNTLASEYVTPQRNATTEKTLTTLPVVYYTTGAFPTTTNNINNNNEKTTAAQILDQLLLTSSNIFELNTQLLHQNATPINDILEENSTTTEAELISTTESLEITEQPTEKITNSVVIDLGDPTNQPPTDKNLISSIEQLISQAVGQIGESIADEKQNLLVQNALNNSANKNMSDVVAETATLASNIINQEEEVTTTERNMLNDISSADTNLLSDSVGSLLSQVYGLDNPGFTTVDGPTTTEFYTTNAVKSTSLSNRKTDDVPITFEIKTNEPPTTIQTTEMTVDLDKYQEMDLNEAETNEPPVDEQTNATISEDDYEPHIINITIISSEKKPAKVDLSQEIDELQYNVTGEILNPEAINSHKEDVGTTMEYKRETTTIEPTTEIDKKTEFLIDLTTDSAETTTVQMLTTEKDDATTKKEELTTVNELAATTQELPTTITEVNPSIVITINENNANNYKLTNDENVATEVHNQETTTLVMDDFTSSPLSTLKLTTTEKLQFTNTMIMETTEQTEAPTTNQNSGAEQEKHSWTLVPTIAPHTDVDSLKIDSTTNHPITSIVDPPAPVDLVPKPLQGFGLEDSTSQLDTDIYQFAQLCNELAFGFWKSVTSGISSARSVFVSPFAASSLLAMVFLGARGATSGEMNEILKLDDMVTFNPHLIFKNISESIKSSPESGVATSAIVRQLYSDRSKGPLLGFYKERAKQFYDGHVEEVSFREIGDVIRRRTNLLVKKDTDGKVQEFLKDQSIIVRSPLAGVSVNIFQTDCSQASTQGRDGELHFVVLPSIRQRRLIPVPAVVYRSGFLAGYEPSLDATAVALGTKDQLVSTIFVIPGQQGIAAPGDGLARLEKRLVESSFKKGAWSRLLRALIPRPGLEVQIPRFSHRSVINATFALKKMGLKDLFDPHKADLRGLNGIAHELHFSEMIQINNFATCGEDRIGDSHHSEIYPATPFTARSARYLDYNYHGDLFEEPRDYQRAFHDPLHDPSYLDLPLPLRPRQARIPDVPRLRFDRPFLYLVRHNPTGLILHMGRFNPRLLP